ncbi:hypothetical protein [Syntrophothermus lipocalidus]|uniref:hypothetical protein n=1 Tax=Syntrophothermus lipocalidus TaxID=86170 RepID=UPI000673E8F5|nr:hypothetical protein [Syntrophothermus lipocalidus]
MKRSILLLISLFSVFLLFSGGCTTVSSSEDVEESPGQALTQTEQKRIDLYLAAMKAVFAEENGGSQFIAVKLETLEGLSSEGKLAVMAGLKDLSPHVYDFEKIHMGQKSSPSGLLFRRINE